MNKSFLIIFLLFLSLTFISANGLNLINGTNQITLNKTSDESKIVYLLLRNEESFTFFNISVVDNPYITFSKISQLNSGSIANISAIVNGNSDFIGDLRIKGFFESNLGQNFETHDVNINFDDGSSPCNFNVVEGDSVIFHNNINDAIKIKNLNTGEEVATLQSNSIYTINFNTPEVFNYYLTRIGLQFGGSCTITSLSTSGLINDPTLDAILNLNLKINYPNTSMSLVTLTDNYTLDYGSSIEDFFKITNTGSEIARNINIKGDWFEFSPNNFNLGIGESKIVSYTLKPSDLTYTNQTNKSYIKNISISGNFNNINKSFNIFVNYKNLDSGNSLNITSLDDLIKTYFDVILSYCLEDANKNLEICQDIKPQTSYEEFQQGLMNTTNLEEQLQELIKKFIEDFDERNKIRNADKQFQTDMLSQLSIFASGQNSTSMDIFGVRGDIKDLKDIVVILLITFFSVILIFALVFIIFYNKKMNLIKYSEYYR